MENVHSYCIDAELQGMFFFLAISKLGELCLAFYRDRYWELRVALYVNDTRSLNHKIFKSL